MSTNDGGPAYPETTGIVDDKGRLLSIGSSGGVSLRTWFAGAGAGTLCPDADADLWGYFRANAATVLEAIQAYDEYMRRRDWRHADAMLVMIAQREKKP